MAAISPTTVRFKCIFLNENAWISIKISLKFVTKGPNENYSRIGSDDGLVPSRRQAIIWANEDQFIGAYMRHSAAISWYGSTYTVYTLISKRRGHVYRMWQYKVL